MNAIRCQDKTNPVSVAPTSSPNSIKASLNHDNPPPQLWRWVALMSSRQPAPNSKPGSRGRSQSRSSTAGLPPARGSRAALIAAIYPRRGPAPLLRQPRQNRQAARRASAHPRPNPNSLRGCLWHFLRIGRVSPPPLPPAPDSNPETLIGCLAVHSRRLPRGYLKTCLDRMMNLVRAED